MSRQEYLIGTSGWQYSDWKGSFYPADLKTKDWLEFYASKLNSVEVNSSFYRIPKKSSCESWAETVSEDFSFVIKANRYFTHIKKLNIDDDFKDRMDLFLGELSPLAAKLKCLLFQLPPNFKADNGKLKALGAEMSRRGANFDIALEFRDASWFDSKTNQVLSDYNMAVVINDSPGEWPATKEITNDFSYIRFHGSKRLYRSDYANEELEGWVNFIQSLSCNKIYGFFNNDFKGRAVKNAVEFSEMLASDS